MSSHPHTAGTGGMSSLLYETGEAKKWRQKVDRNNANKIKCAGGYCGKFPGGPTLLAADNVAREGAMLCGYCREQKADELWNRRGRGRAPGPDQRGTGAQRKAEEPQKPIGLRDGKVKHRHPTCPRGHNKDVVGRNSSGACRECERQRKRKGPSYQKLPGLRALFDAATVTIGKKTRKLRWTDIEKDTGLIANTVRKYASLDSRAPEPTIQILADYFGVTFEQLTSEEGREDDIDASNSN